MEKKKTLTDTIYQSEVSASLDALKTSSEGLLATEANKRRAVHDLNVLKTKSTNPAWRKYIRQYKDLMIVLLLASAFLSLYLSDIQTALVLVVLVFFNTTLGFAQEYRAERTMQALEKLVSSSAQVYREGKLYEVDATLLVPGDVIRINEGDSVPADLRIIEESELSTNDFALTGESNPTRKFTHAISAAVPVNTRHNLAFMGTTVATGEAKGLVVGTGMQTELGRIASLSKEASQDSSPLQNELNNIAGRISVAVVLLSAILLPISIHAELGIQGAFLFAIGFASSLIPQGLPAEINTALAQAANKLSRAKALVKKLSAVETLGATHIICTDKTGTLTKNQMTVESLITGHEVYNVSGTGYSPEGNITATNNRRLSGEQLETMADFFKCGAFASNAKVLPPDTDHATWYCLGDPTEGALITLARKAGLNIESLEIKHPELKEFTFDSARKRMSSIREIGGSLHVFVKGSPEGVLEKCTHIYEHGNVRKLTKTDRQRYMKYHTTQAQKAMRNLVFASKTLPKDNKVTDLSIEKVESNLTLLGMVSMIDPLRDEVPMAMEAAHLAHIRVNVITGDFALTAQAIAEKAGLNGKNEHLKVIGGDELNRMKDAEILKHVRLGGTIFSRVSPEDKLRIVEIIKASGEVVAVTGDGINDAPALKRADIGVAMGVTGTDVAKQSAEIILLDDSFHTLVHSVQAGRTIFANIKKGALSCFTSNSAELVTNLVSLGALSLFGIPLAIGVMQILAIDLVAELFPIAALGWDQAEGELMNEKPRNVREHILNTPAVIDLLWCGLIIGALAFSNYLMYFSRNHISPYGLSTNSDLYIKATTVTYVTIVMCQLINIIQRRSKKGFFTRFQLTNPHFWGAILFSLFCVLNIVYNPYINQYFGSGAISLIDWVFAITAAAIFLFIREIQLKISRRTVSA